MGIFSNIMDKIFGSNAASAAPAFAGGGTRTQSAAGPSTSGTAAPKASPTGASVDVTAMLDERAGKAGQRLNWRQSIVDLMKLLDLDSSLAARKDLARELNYTGDMNDTAAMNIWLHKQVMAKIAANGGKVPEELK